MSGCTDVACAVEIGRMLNVELIVVGNVDKVGSIYSVNIRLVDVASGKIIKNEIDDCAQCSLDQVFLNTLKSAVYKIAGLEPESKPRPQPQPTVSDYRPVEPVVRTKPKPPSRFKMGFYTALSTSASMNVDDAHASIKHNGSTELGLTYDVGLYKNLFFKQELLYTNRRAILYGNEDNWDVLHYIDIPLLISYHLGSFSQIFIGPSFGFLVGSGYEIAGEDGHYEEDEVNGSINRLIFGAELSLGSLRLGYRYANDLGLERDHAYWKVSRNIQYLTLGLMISR